MILIHVDPAGTHLQPSQVHRCIYVTHHLPRTLIRKGIVGIVDEHLGRVDSSSVETLDWNAGVVDENARVLRRVAHRLHLNRILVVSDGVEEILVVVDGEVATERPDDDVARRPDAAVWKQQDAGFVAALQATHDQSIPATCISAMTTAPPHGVLTNTRAAT